MPSSERRRLPGAVAPVLATAVVAWLVWRGVLNLALYAWDTFPLIASGRSRSWSELAHALGSELMGGRFPGGHYYRPLVHLSFARDYAMWELGSRGYHLTDLAWLALGGCALTWLASLLLGPSNRRWAFLAGLVYVLHPVQFDIAPLPPRRADSMSVALTLLALAFCARKRGRLSIAASLCALAAVASKETGALAPALMFALAAAQGAGGWRERALAGLKSSWLALLLVAVFLVARQSLLGGLGGGARASLEGSVGALDEVVLRYSELLLQPLPPSWMPGGGFALALATAMVVFLLFVVARARPAAGAEPALEPRAGAVLVVAWWALLVLPTAAAGTFRAWYALPFVPPLALLVALAASTVRVGGAAPLRTWAAITVLALLQGWFGGRAERWAEIHASSDAARAFLQHFDEVVESLEPGSLAELDAYPDQAATTRFGRELQKTMLFREYSLQAYAELAHPGRKLRIAVKRGPAPRVEPDEVVVLLVPRELGE